VLSKERYYLNSNLFADLAKTCSHAVSLSKEKISQLICGHDTAIVDIIINLHKYNIHVLISC